MLRSLRAAFKFEGWAFKQPGLLNVSIEIRELV